MVLKSAQSRQAPGIPLVQAPSRGGALPRLTLALTLPGLTQALPGLTLALALPRLALAPLALPGLRVFVTVRRYRRAGCAAAGRQRCL